jgi:glutamyl-tRNA synthetase
MTATKPARVRFAPSPTGRFHIGGARTALYDVLLARQSGGQFILRIEDTDQKRYVPSAEQEIMTGLAWLGLDWDEGPDVGGPYGPYRQSERREIYQRHAETLLQNNHAYACFCSQERIAQVRTLQQQRKEPPRYDGHCRNLNPDEAAARRAAGEAHVIRFKAPQAGTTTAIDLLRNPIVVDNKTIDDYVLVKSDGLPVYHLAAMVDDHEMQITHVLRGSEWLGTFPRHVLLFEAFGWEQPIWVHLPLFLNPTGKGKLSKRFAEQQSVDVTGIFVTDFIELGYLSQAVNNWMALMGWALDDHTEFFTLPDLIQGFKLQRVNTSDAAVNFSKLDHFNGLHIRALSTDALCERLIPFFEQAGYENPGPLLRRIAPIIQERIRTLDEALDMARFFFLAQLDLEPQDLVGKNMTPAQSAQTLRHARQTLADLPDLKPEPTEAALRSLADELELNAGQIFGLLRQAVTGQRVSPPLTETMEIVGQETVLARLEQAAALLENTPIDRQAGSSAT